jgi:hypothetical protein
MNRRFPIAVIAASGLFAVSADRLAAQDDDAPQPPVEVTACIEPGPEVHRGTTEQLVVPVTDGDMTISQTSVSDPRLEGTLYQAVNQDDYTLPGDEPNAGISDNRPTGLAIGTFTNRIENDEGAWEGSAVQLDFPDGTTYVAPLVMSGEGYEGLTAIVGFVDIWSDCAVTGYIINGSVPGPPTPQTEQ